jgi:hypothetical protein
MQLRRLAAGDYLCGDDEWFSIRLVGRRWRIIAGGDTLDGSHDTLRDAAAALAALLRNWRTAV